MYKDEPWTLKNKKSSIKKQDKRTSKNYIKERQTDLAISISRVQKLFELHKEKTFNTAQIAEILDLSEGTVSSIMNRLITLGDINVVTMQRPHWAPVFQHSDSAPSRVNFTYKKEDPILNVIKVFKENIDTIYTKEDLLKKLACSESMLRRILQILLLKGDIKLVGSKEGKAQYQHKDGDMQGIKVSSEINENYIKLTDYLKEKDLLSKQDTIKSNLKGVEQRLFYSSTGLTVEYLKESLDKAIEKMSKKKFLGLF